MARCELEMKCNYAAHARFFFFSVFFRDGYHCLCYMEMSRCVFGSLKAGDDDETTHKQECP